MKRIVLSAFVALCGILLPPFTASGQLFPDFVLANDGINNNMPSGSIIRAVNTTEAVVYYEDGGLNYVAAINLTGNVSRISFDPDYKVLDMRYCNGTVFLCGTYLHKAFVAAIPYSDILSTMPSPTAQIVPLTLTVPYDFVSLNRMVVYSESATGLEKIIAVGEEEETVIGYQYQVYVNGIVVELDYDPGATVPFALVDSRHTNSTLRVENISEVVATDNYIALIGYDVATSSIAIHRCPKGANILSPAFDYYYTYPGTDGDGCSPFHGCHLKKDTIAIASLSYREYSPNHEFETRIRTFDLSTMDMTTAQAIFLDAEKAEPEELVYLPQYQTLVLLQDFCFLASTPDYAFIHLKPYALSGYNAHGWVETHPTTPPASALQYHSVDLLQGKHYISSGGNYWLKKDSQLDVANTSCYTCGTVPVDHILVSIPIGNSDSYNKPNPNPISLPAFSADNTYFMSLICNP